MSPQMSSESSESAIDHRAPVPRLQLGWSFSAGLGPPSIEYDAATTGKAVSQESDESPRRLESTSALPPSAFRRLGS